MRSGIPVVIAFLYVSCASTASLAGDPKRSSVHAGKSGTVSSSPAAKSKQRRTLTERDALRIVTNRPEVKKWKRAVDVAAKAKKVSAIIEVDREEDGAFVVHAYEMVPDEGDTGHSATFNWYHVNERTGKVSAEF